MDFFKLHSFIANLRYKSYRLGQRLSLGKFSGKAIGINLCRSLEEASARPKIAKHILDRTCISNAYVQKYPFPDNFPSYFPREEAFSSRFAYLLSDVVISPHRGGMWFENEAFLQESLGCIPRIFGWGGIKETLLPIKKKNVPTPIVPLANAGYYHVLMESIPQALHALEHYPETRLLIPRTPKKHLLNILEFLNLLNETRIVRSNYPLRVQQAVLVPRWVNSGFVPQEDIDILRKHILPKLKKTRKRKLYISRSKCDHRSLSNEVDLEKELKKRGFEIVFFEEMSFSQQMISVANAELIVAPHGAGLANIIAGSTGLAIIEIISPNWFNTCYAKLARQCGFDYQYVTTELNNSNSYQIPIDTVIEQIQLATRPKSLTE